MFLEAIPDTSRYMIAGYLAAFLVMSLYVSSMYLHYRRLRQELKTLETIRSPQKPKPAPIQVGPAGTGKKRPKTSVKKRR